MKAATQSAETAPDNRIGEFRVKHGMSFADIGVRCAPKATASEVRKVERGDTKLTLDWMRRIAPAFGVRPGELLLERDSEIDAQERSLIYVIREISGKGIAPALEAVSSLVAVMSQIHDGASAAKMLPGDPKLASRMGMLWSSADDDERRKILDLTDMARGLTLPTK